MIRPRRFGERLLTAVPPWSALGGVGIAMVAVSIWNFLRELSRFGAQLSVVAAAALSLSLSAAVVYAAVSLRGAEFDRSDGWTVVASGIAGGLLAVTAQSLTFLIRVAEGRPVGEPQLPLLVVGSIGVLGGVVVGQQYVLARRRAREAETARDAMAFTNELLRHDVRNGMQVIDANAGVLAESDDESVRERAEAIRSQSKSVTSLITEVESVSAVLTGDVETERIDLAALLSDVVETVRESHPDASIELSCPPELAVRGTDALEPVFSNIVTNAIQHVGEDVSVRVSAERDDGTVRVRVADDGPGIPPEDRDRIFRRGVSTDGGGQGLYVADTIVRRLGGDVSVGESQWGGAAFVVELPAADGT